MDVKTYVHLKTDIIKTFYVNYDIDKKFITFYVIISIDSLHN